MSWWGEVAWHDGAIVHLAALVTITGLLMRDQLKLRALVLVGNGLYALYYFVAPPLPLWDAMFWSVAMGIANAVMAVIVWQDRRHRLVDEDALHVFAALQTMTPGDFRRLMALGRASVALVPLELTRRGERPERLWFVTAGKLVIERDDRRITVERPMFIGEVAFLLGAPATATVTLAAGGRYVRWDVDRLHALLERRPQIARSFDRAFGIDLAAKLKERQQH